LEPSTGICYYKVATTVNIQNWLVATTHPNASTPGSNQPACWAVASNVAAIAETGTQNPQTETVLVDIFEKYTFNVCWNDGSSIFPDLRYNCLLTGDVVYQIGAYDYFGRRGEVRRKWWPDAPLGLGCKNYGQFRFVGDGRTPATYTAGTAPTDWKDISLVDVVPLNSNNNSSQTRGYSQIQNSMTEVNSTATLYTGDPTIHNHEIILERGDPAYNLITESVLMEPDALNTQLTLSTSNAVSLDAVSSPFIIMEYLIKI
jgi:hypothetical protein